MSTGIEFKVSFLSFLWPNFCWDFPNMPLTLIYIDIYDSSLIFYFFGDDENEAVDDDDTCHKH